MTYNALILIFRELCLSQLQLLFAFYCNILSCLYACLSRPKFDMYCLAKGKAVDGITHGANLTDAYIQVKKERKTNSFLLRVTP